jgi:hypothetical protein
MDKAPASLIDAQPSSLQPGYGGTAGINQYVLRPGQPYLSGAHILSAVKALSGVPYWMAGLAIQTCNNMYITAPEPAQKSKITHSASQLYTAGQYAVGQAPTSGIFTGVEDTCS